MASGNEWVLWKWKLKEGRRNDGSRRDGTRREDWTKPPYDIHGRYAQTNNPSTWNTFDAVRTGMLKGGDYAGVGFCLSASDGLTGIDLDHCIDPDTLEITQPAAVEIVKRFECTRIERSPSGDGLRIWVKGKAKRSGKAPQHRWVEVYTSPSSRYLTVTGHRWDQSAEDITEQHAALDWLHETYMEQPREKRNRETEQSSGPSRTDKELIEKIRSSRQGGGI